jgi:hypothetical protein
MTNHRQAKNAIGTHFFNGFVLVEKEVDADRKTPTIESLKFAITTEEYKTPMEC